jgi:transcriptional regulator with XRE-family HTH domain
MGVCCAPLVTAVSSLGDGDQMKKPSSLLRSARERCGLTIREVRALTGIPTGRLSMLERDMVAPKDSERLRLAEALRARVEDIFGGAVTDDAASAPRGLIAMGGPLETT